MLSFTIKGTPSEGWCIQGKKKAAQTRGGQPLILPTEALATAIANQLTEQGPKSPLFLIASAGIDLVRPDMPNHVAEAMRFLDTDLTCYRTPEPHDLRAAQDKAWDPVWAWAKGVGLHPLKRTEAVSAIEQDKTVRKGLQRQLEMLDFWHLLLCHRVTHQVGSVLMGLMFAKGDIDAERLYQSAFVEEHYQTGRYGPEAELDKKLAVNRAVMDELYAFRNLLS